MEPFIGQIKFFGTEPAPTTDSKHDGWIIIESMSSPIFRSIPEG